MPICPFAGIMEQTGALRAPEGGFLNKKPAIRQESFRPLELNAGNVQAVFDRCLYTMDSQNRVEAHPFYQRLGYSEEEQDKVIYFNQDIPLKTKRVFSIPSARRLPFTGERQNSAQAMGDFMTAYFGNNWINDRICLLQPLYFERKYGDGNSFAI